MVAIITVENLGEGFEVGGRVPGQINLRELVGATAAEAGAAGVAPAPAAGEQEWFLRGDGTWRPVPTATWGEAVLASSVALTGANHSWQESGLAVTLPAAGVYLVGADVRGAVTGSAADHFVAAALYNQAASALVVHSERLVAYGSVANVSQRGAASIQAVVSVAAATEIALVAKRSGSGSWISSVLVSNGDGRTVLRYVQLA